MRHEREGEKSCVRNGAEDAVERGLAGGRRLPDRGPVEERVSGGPAAWRRAFGRKTCTCQSSRAQDEDEVARRVTGGLERVENTPVVTESANGNEGDQVLL